MLDKAYLEITNICNLSCSFCHGTVREARSLSREEFGTLTDALRGKVKYLYFHVLGEPLLHPELPLFIRASADKGFLPMLTTNGTLLPERGEELLDTPIRKISISMHAPEANGAFASPEYISGCISFVKKAAGNGIISVLRLWNEGGLDAGNSAILDALHDEFCGEWKENRSGYRLADHIYIERGKKFNWPDLNGPELGDCFFCYGLRDQIGILADGTVVPCCLDAEGACPLGNLFETTLEEILISPRAKKLYEGFSSHRAEEKLCRTCGYAAETNAYRRHL
ncbi:MAG: SPASM domain-containing protein [Eubacteriales bacterium]|nr:SPASM domain-containing protein [Eubacteriales bacterium]